jgi:hypothetical protein
MTSFYTMSPRLKGRESATVIILTGNEGGEKTKSVHYIIGRDAAGVAEDAEAIALEELRKGATIHLRGGGRVWRERRARFHIVDGLSRYEWHEDGERVRCDWHEITMTPDGKRSERRLRSVWVQFDNI